MKPEFKSVPRFLDECAWFTQLPAEQRRQVVADAYVTTHQRREVVARTGEAARSWLGVADGLLKVSTADRSGKVVMLTGVSVGGWVGEGSVLKEEVRRYDIVAMRETRVVHIPRSTFLWLLESSVGFCQFILKHLNERLGQYIGMVQTDRIADPATRLSRAIASLFNPILHPNAGSMLRISQEDFGDLAGLSRQRTNAALKQLERAGYVKATYGCVEILDLMQLRSFADEAC